MKILPCIKNQVYTPRLIGCKIKLQTVQKYLCTTKQPTNFFFLIIFGVELLRYWSRHVSWKHYTEFDSIFKRMNDLILASPIAICFFNKMMDMKMEWFLK